MCHNSPHHSLIVIQFNMAVTKFENYHSDQKKSFQSIAMMLGEEGGRGVVVTEKCAIMMCK